MSDNATIICHYDKPYEQQGAAGIDEWFSLFRFFSRCYFPIWKLVRMCKGHLIYTFGLVFRSNDNQSPHSFGQILRDRSRKIFHRLKWVTDWRYDENSYQKYETLIQYVSRYCCYCEMHSHIIVVVTGGWKKRFPRSVMRKLCGCCNTWDVCTVDLWTIWVAGDIVKTIVWDWLNNLCNGTKGPLEVQGSGTVLSMLSDLKLFRLSWEKIR